MNIYVGSLPANTSANSLLDYFSSLVKVAELKRIKNKGKKSPGYAIFKVETQQEYDFILSKEHFIKGHKLTIKPYLTPKQRLDLEKSLLERRVYIKNLPDYAPVEELKLLFKRFGEVQSVVVKQKQSQKEVYGFVTFSSKSFAEKSIDEGFIEFREKDVEIRRYKINKLKFRNEMPKGKKRRIVDEDPGPQRRNRIVEFEGSGRNRRVCHDRHRSIRINFSEESERDNQFGYQQIDIWTRRLEANFKGYPKPAFKEKIGLYWIKEKLVLRSIVRRVSIISKKHDSYNLRFNKGC